MARKALKRIFIANRGEIACRLIQACQEMGKFAVAVYSEADDGARHAELADLAIAIGGRTPLDSYLKVDNLVRLAKENNCDAVHPGYGFLSERADAAQAFIDAGIAWIGPTPQNIKELGNKIAAKKLLDRAKIPTLPWCEIDPTDVKKLKETGTKVGYPLLLKAAAGGGGKGMRLVRKSSELEAAAESAAREGQTSFGDPTIFMEKFLENPRHIEVQIMGDEKGNVYHFGERDCSSQRRHQKVIEEAPAAEISTYTRTEICKAACDLGELVGYTNAGTIEFLMDDRNNFYFLEMNSRLQVEHSVSEAVWGVDLVHLQLKIAEGELLPSLLPDWKNRESRGHAIEARVYAEDPQNQFMPSPGTLLHLEWPQGPGIRIDTGIKENFTIGLDYDPMIAKITVWAPDRDRAIEKLIWCLQKTIVFGTTTNINYLQDILGSTQFRDCKIHVKSLETDFKDWKNAPPEDLLEELDSLPQLHGASISSTGPAGFPSPWESL